MNNYKIIRGIKSIHHIGIVLKDIDSMRDYYIKMGFKKHTEKIHDKKQKVNVQMLKHGNIMIELLEPVGKDSPIIGALRKNGRLNHICYLTENLNESIEDIKNYGAIITSLPSNSAAIKNGKVAFLVTKDRDLIELVEIL